MGAKSKSKVIRKAARHIGVYREPLADEENVQPTLVESLYGVRDLRGSYWQHF